jgi:hypothetical protein
VNLAIISEVYSHLGASVGYLEFEEGFIGGLFCEMLKNSIWNEN